MKKIIFMSLVLCGFSSMALEVGDLVQSGVSLNHLMADGTEKIQDVLLTEKGQKLTVLEFFSTTCPACIENQPQFIKLANELSDRATFKLVGLDRNEKQLRDFYQKNRSEIVFPYVLDHKRLATKAFKVSATPTSFILDESGKILFKHEGVFEAADLQTIRTLLK